MMQQGSLRAEVRADLPSLHELGALLAEQIPRLGPEDIATIGVPAPLVHPEALLDVLPEQEALVWDTPSGAAFSGAGACSILRASGAERFSSIVAQARALWGRVVPLSARHRAPAPRLFGGFAFAPRAPTPRPWSEFGDALFVLPRYGYSRTDREAWLSVALPRQELIALGAEGLIAELERLRQRLTLVPARTEATALRSVLEVDTPEHVARFVGLATELHQAILQGQFEKVVLAERRQLQLRPAPQPSAVLARLRGLAPECLRFALRSGSSTFLGATPERLVQKQGLDVFTEAVAGSIRAGHEARDALLGSQKDRAEHAFVVREIVRQLEPLSTTLWHAPEPQVRALRHLLHLCTPMRARLRDQCHVLDLVERLHPTPAVGGLPREAALGWIVASEPEPRGWYSGPIGWFDAAGDGEFHVALRSGILDGEHAYLYAGAGIVRDSNPEHERAETQLKMQVLRAALGVVP